MQAILLLILVQVGCISVSACMQQHTQQGSVKRWKGGMQGLTLADSPEDVADHGLAHGEVGHRHFVVLEVVVNGVGGGAGGGGVGGCV